MEKNIRDIAKEAGVSIATVSKVINDYPHVSAKTRDKVKRVIRDSRFIPNSAARELVRKRSMTIGLLLTTSLIHPFFHRLLIGMESALKKSGYDLIYLAQVSWNKDYSVVQHCRSRNVEGVLLFGFQRHDLNLDELVSSEIPTIFIDLDLLGRRAGYITSDNAASLRNAIQYLYGLNHRRIAFLSGSPDSYVGKTRFDAYTNSLSEFGLPFKSEFVAFGDFSKESGYLGMKKLLQQKQQPTAVLCSSDLEAIGAIEAAQEEGLNVPEDLSVIGFDDIDIAAHYTPALTTIRQDIQRLGREALELLVELVQNPDQSPPSVVIPTELIIRESCAEAK